MNTVVPQKEKYMPKFIKNKNEAIKTVAAPRLKCNLTEIIRYIDNSPSIREELIDKSYRLGEESAHNGTPKHIGLIDFVREFKDIFNKANYLEDYFIAWHNGYDDKIKNCKGARK